MFNIGFSELLLVLLVAFLVVGPKDLPKVARWLGRTVKKSRRLLNEIKKESGWDELEKEVRDVQHDVKDAVKQGDVSAELREAKKSVQDSAEKFDKDTNMRLGTTEIILIVVLALVLFGGGKLAGVGKALGKSIKDFKNEVKDDKAEERSKEDKKDET